MTETAVLSSLHSKYTSSFTVHRQWAKVSKRVQTHWMPATQPLKGKENITCFRGTNGDASQMVGPKYVSLSLQSFM